MSASNRSGQRAMLAATMCSAFAIRWVWMWWQSDAVVPAVYLGLEGVLLTGLVYVWCSRLLVWPATRMAIVVTAFHPMLVSVELHSVVDALVAAAWLAVLLLASPPRGTDGRRLARIALAGGLGFGLLGVVTLVILGPQRTTGYWFPVGQEAVLRDMLVIYLLNGAVYCLAVVGVWFGLSNRPLDWVVPVIAVAGTGAVALVDKSQGVARIFPILIVLASHGMWHIYVGLGRTSGHGILAIDPIKEKRPVRPREAQPDA